MILNKHTKIKIEASSNLKNLAREEIQWKK